MHNLERRLAQLEERVETMLRHQECNCDDGSPAIVILQRAEETKEQTLARGEALRTRHCAIHGEQAVGTVVMLRSGEMVAHA